MPAYVHICRLCIVGLILLVLLGPPIFLGKGERERASDVSLKMLFVGDMMYDRDIRRVMEKNSSHGLFENIKEELSSFNFVVGNLEGPITPHASVSRGSLVGDPQNKRFTFSESIVPALVENNVRLFHLGNNHILDFGYEGLDYTLQALKKNDGYYFFDVQGKDTTPLYMKVNDIHLAFISYNEFLGHSVEKTTTLVSKAKEQGDIVIVYAHWGVEYQTEPPIYIRERARHFVDAGASLVVGSHSHVVGSTEVYNGSRIYYSLGNFVFDQYWSTQVRCGLALSVTVYPSKALVTEPISVAFKEGRVHWGVCI